MAPNASINPTTGEIKRDSNTSIVFFIGRIILGSVQYITSDTQRIEPISVCELDAGSPIYQVPKFHMIAAMRSESTAQIPKAILE